MANIKQVMPETYMTVDIINLLKNEKTAIAAKVSKSLERAYDRNNVSIINYRGTFYFEGNIPKYVREYLKNYIEEKYYAKYLYSR